MVTAGTAHSGGRAAVVAAAPHPLPVDWPPEHWQVPQVSPGPAQLRPTGGGDVGDGIKPIFFEGAAYRGQATSVFAFIGVPQNLTAGAAACPGMVLLHGGGGTAMDVWVREWTERGFAAICFDQCGDMPAESDAGDGAAHSRHERGGPPGWDASFGTTDDPVHDQWPFHAVAAALRAHSLLAAHPNVDSTRIGLTGISWGGFLTCIAQTRHDVVFTVSGLIMLHRRKSDACAL
jgi:hypothetical protein